MPARSPLSLAEWVVLTLVDEEPTHGFAVAALTARDGAVGRVWQVPRPVVYRALRRLADLDKLTSEPAEPGQGPARHPLTATAQAHADVARWLEEPVEHVRLLRSELLVKLALLDRRALEPTRLLARQRLALGDIAAATQRPEDAPTGFDVTLLAWRRAQVQAAYGFIDTLAPPT